MPTPRTTPPHPIAQDPLLLRLQAGIPRVPGLPRLERRHAHLQQLPQGTFCVFVCFIVIWVGRLMDHGCMHGSTTRPGPPSHRPLPNLHLTPTHPSKPHPTGPPPEVRGRRGGEQPGRRQGQRRREHGRGHQEDEVRGRGSGARARSAGRRSSALRAPSPSSVPFLLIFVVCSYRPDGALDCTKGA